MLFITAILVYRLAPRWHSFNTSRCFFRLGTERMEAPSMVPLVAAEFVFLQITQNPKQNPALPSVPAVPSPW